MNKYDKICEEAYTLAKKEISVSNKDWLDSPWEGFFDNREAMVLPKTGVDEEVLKHVGTVFSSPPPGDFVIHGGKITVNISIYITVLLEDLQIQTNLH